MLLQREMFHQEDKILQEMSLQDAETHLGVLILLDIMIPLDVLILLDVVTHKTVVLQDAVPSDTRPP